MKQWAMPLEPTSTATSETVVRRSRFIATATPTAGVSDAEAAIAAARESHPAASHVVYAFLVGEPQSEHAGMSDAGEPKGTAGRPVMDVLRGSGVWNVTITVVRYFGGTKLGTGGLVRAYGDAARRVLEVLPVRERVARTRATCSVPYELHERVRRIVEEAGGTVTAERYDTTVDMTIELPTARYEEAEVRVTDVSRGEVKLVAENA
ncbi:MAG: IMPACT family protein [Spirochaetota bacterium]